MHKDIISIYNKKLELSEKTKILPDSSIDVSFIISTRKNGSNRINLVIEKLKKIKSFTYEILVFSDDSYNNAITIKEEDNGSCYAYNKLASISKGRYISVLTDYSVPPDNIDSIYDYINNNNINIATMSACNHYKPCLLNDCVDIMSYISGSGSFFKHSIKTPIQIIFFPIVKRTYLYHMFNGHLFNPFFHHRYVDNWMGFFQKKIELLFNTFTPSHELPMFRACTGACKPETRGHIRNSEYDDYDLAVFRSLISSDPNNYSSVPEFNLLKKMYNEQTRTN